jgi:hypothetical protein
MKDFQLIFSKNLVGKILETENIVKQFLQSPK